MSDAATVADFLADALAHIEFVNSLVGFIVVGKFVAASLMEMR